MFSEHRLDFLSGSQISEQCLLWCSQDSMELSELLFRFLGLKLLLEKLLSTVDNKIRIKMLLQIKNK